MNIEFINKYLVPIDSFVFSIGFVGNVIAWIVIFFSRSMRTLTDFYLLSLSTSDLLILITGVLYDLLAFLYSERIGDENHFRDNAVAYCFHQWIFQTSAHASILTVTAFTVERYLAICHPFLVQSMDNQSRAKKIIAIIWMVAAILALLPATEFFFNLDKFSSNINTPLPEAFANAWPYMVFIRVIVYFVLPMLFITIMYILIGIKLRKISNERQMIASQADRINTRALQMFFVIIMAFFISWTPYYIEETMSYYKYSEGLVDDEMYFHVSTIRLFTYNLSSALNPIIYVAMSRNFRKSLRDLLSRSRKKLSDWSSMSTNTQIHEISVEMASL